MHRLNKHSYEKHILKLAIGAVSILASCSNEQSAKKAPQGHEEHNNSGPGVAATDAGEMQRIMDQMMRRMHSAKSSGNPDRDFAALMISHHQGAIEMAKAELASGTVAEISKLAETIIAAQKKRDR